MSAFSIEQFRDAIRAAGIEPPDLIKTDGKLHRFSSDGRRGDDAGWYILHAGDIPAGAFGCWRSDIYETWRADIGRELTAEEIAANRRKISEAKRKQEEEKKKSQAKARARAGKIWGGAANAPSDHPYLATKGISAHGLKFDHDELVVPMYDSAGVLHNLQFIAADGAKNFLFGGRVAGCHHVIGEPNGVLCTAEGFATGASVYEVTGHAVAVGFNAANLPLVAKELRAKFSDLRFIICADDDARTPSNPGLKYAREAAEAVGGYLAVPDFGENRPSSASDFNDLLQCAGPEAVRACIERAVPFEARAEHRLDPIPVPVWEAALAHEFIDRHSHEFRYVDQWGRWMRWTGAFWEHEATRLVHDLTARICRDSAQWFKDNGKPPPKDLGKFRTVSAVEMYARHERAVAAAVKQWDEDEWLLNTAGGAVVFSNRGSK